MINVFFSRPIPEAPQRLRDAGLTVDVYEKDALIPGEELRARLQGHAAFVSMLDDEIDEEFLEACPALKIIAQFAVGFNNIDVPAATRRGIIVTNTPDVLTDATADLTWALMLSASRRIIECDRFVRNGEWHGWGPQQFLGWQISGKTLGIVGFGRIGRAVARRAHGFNMRVLYYGRRRSEEWEKETGAQFRTLDELLTESDFISLNCPLNDDTCGMIGRAQIARMKSNAILVNTARGPVVDESALADALREKKIAAAGLDVYENEPQVHPDLIDLPNVVLAPHVGSGTIETRTKMALLCADNVLAYLEGKTPPTIVNPEVLQK